MDRVLSPGEGGKSCKWSAREAVEEEDKLQLMEAIAKEERRGVA